MGQFTSAILLTLVCGAGQTYVMRADARVWKIQEHQTSTPDNALPRRVQSARRPVKSERTEKKMAMRANGKMNRVIR
jgi:hypothetical protein